MNYYKHHIGDYAAATAHLTWDEDMAYTRLLRTFYRDERPLPADIPTTCRLVRATTKPQKDAVARVLQEFFSLSAEGWVQGRAEKEVIRKNEICEANRLIALEREATKRARLEHEAFTADESKREPSHKPLATSHKDQKLSSPSGDQCPHAEIVAAYHDALPANPRMKVWNGKREAALRSRWREDPKRQSLDYWRRFFAHVAASPFLTGQVAGTNGRPFLPGLDWLVLPENFAKVIEGRYHDRA